MSPSYSRWAKRREIHRISPSPIRLRTGTSIDQPRSGSSPRRRASTVPRAPAASTATAMMIPYQCTLIGPSRMAMGSITRRILPRGGRRPGSGGRELGGLLAAVRRQAGEPIQMPEHREDAGPEERHEQSPHAAHQHGRHDPPPRGGDARLELAELV